MIRDPPDRLCVLPLLSQPKTPAPGSACAGYHRSQNGSTLEHVSDKFFGAILKRGRTGVAWATGVLLLVAVGVPLAILGLRDRERSLPRWLQRLPWAHEVFAAIADAHPGAIFGGTLAPETVTLQLAIFALDATTLGIMLLAIATPTDAAVVFASFVVASMVATLSWVPGGLGTFEGTCVAMLHVHGVAIEAALAATLLARGFTFWLPMAPGLAIARREMMRGTTTAGPTTWAETP